MRPNPAGDHNFNNYINLLIFCTNIFNQALYYVYSYSYMQMCIKFSVIQQSIEPINYGDMDYEYGIK